MKKKEYYSKTYRANCVFFIGTPEEFLKYWNKRLKSEVDIDIEWLRECSGAHFTLVKPGSSTYRVLWVKEFKKNKPDSYATVSHEAVHMANSILQYKGVETTQENDEALAYLVEEITEEFLIWAAKK